MWLLVCGCDHKLIGKAERFPEGPGPGLCSGSGLQFPDPSMKRTKQYESFVCFVLIRMLHFLSALLHAGTFWAGISDAARLQWKLAHRPKP